MRIHVNMHIIRANKKNDTRDPVITCKTSKSNTYAYSVDIDGPSKVINSPDKPLSCGARLWIECDSDDVKMLDEEGNEIASDNRKIISSK